MQTLRDSIGPGSHVDLQEENLATRMEVIGLVSMQLINGGLGMHSEPPSVPIVDGHTVLRLLQQGGSTDSVAMAERAASSLLGIHESFKSSSRRLLILEGAMTAAKQSCKQGKSGSCWGASSQMSALLHTLVAVLAVKHGLVAIPQSNHTRTLALLGALSTSMLTDLLKCKVHTHIYTYIYIYIHHRDLRTPRPLL